jgi:hypothetical protein
MKNKNYSTVMNTLKRDLFRGERILKALKESEAWFISRTSAPWPASSTQSSTSSRRWMNEKF